ncbi:MAG TPA: hypothetical protein VEP90_13175 [Methylomirabilota bacterium]|nr:hypothetical protein [Methylomirabilota bacterium]
MGCSLNYTATSMQGKKRHNLSLVSVISVLMRSIIKNGLGNVRTVFFASDEWRGGESIKSQDHTRLERTKEVKGHEAPRGQPQKRSGEAHFLVKRTADLVAHESLANCLLRGSLSPFSSRYGG